MHDEVGDQDAERRDLETLRAAIREGLNSGPGIPADQVFAELRARYPGQDEPTFQTAD